MLGATGASLIAPAGIGAVSPAAAATRTPVDVDVPRGACDCHVHVFGDPRNFPFAANRAYTPPGASVEELQDLQRALRLERVVIVQPSVYATDNSCTVDGIRRLGAKARGIAVLDKAASAGVLDDMAAAGIRGVRLNLETAGEFDPAAANRLLGATAEQIRGRDWHIQLYTRLPVIAARMISMPCRSRSSSTISAALGRPSARASPASTP